MNEAALDEIEKGNLNYSVEQKSEFYSTLIFCKVFE